MHIFISKPTNLLIPSHPAGTRGICTAPRPNYTCLVLSHNRNDHCVPFSHVSAQHIRLSLTYWDHHRGLTPLPAARNDKTFKRRRKRNMRLKPTVAVLVVCNHQLIITAEVFSQEWRESEGLILIVTQVHALQYVTIQQRQKVQFFVYY